MNRKKAFLQELKEMGLSMDEFLEQSLIKGPSPTEIEGELYLKQHDKENETEQRVIKLGLIYFALHEKKEWAWNPLVELVERESMNPILKDKFVMPVLRGNIQHPKKEKMAWNTLIELVKQESMNPILKDKFVLPVLWGNIQHPKHRKKSKGGQKTEEFRDRHIT